MEDSLETLKIEDLINTDSVVIGHLRALIISAKTKLTKTNSTYLSITLSDNTGSISGMLWNVTDSLIKTFTVGTVIDAVVQSTSYQNRPMIEFVSNNVDVVDNVEDLSSYVVHESFSAEDEYAELSNEIEKIKDQKMYEITHKLFNNFTKSEWLASTAAVKMHHAYPGGLVHHTATMLRDALALAKKSYPYANLDLIRSGTILHDYGKLIEYTPYPSTITELGHLYGHISITFGLIIEASLDLGYDPFKDESIILLSHMVLSHHGKTEYGSPVTPAIPEAIILHNVDMLDADMQKAHQALIINDKSSEFTQGVLLDGGFTQIYSADSKTKKK